MEGIIIGLSAFVLLIGVALTYDYLRTRRILKDIYIGRMVNAHEDGFTYTGTVIAFNEDEVIISTMEGLVKTTPNRVYFVY